MADQINITDKIDRYLNHEMTGDELTLFQNEIETNPELKIEIEQQKDITNYLEENGNKELKGFLKDIESNINNSSSIDSKKNATVISLRKIVTSIAAGFAIILASTWAFRQTQIQQPSELFSEYYSPYPNDLVKIERSSDENSILQKAMINYNQKNYQEAINDIDQYMLTDDTEHLDNELSFFKAISHLSIDNLGEAKESLELLNSIDDFEYSDKVNWYLSLLYLKNGQTEKAKTSLHEIVNSGQTYKVEEAKVLLDQL